MNTERLKQSDIFRRFTMRQNSPTIDSTVFVHNTAVIIGNVVIGKYCGIFPNAVIRGDQNYITIEEGSNVQECCVIHVNEEHPVEIGKNVSLGHASMVHGATIEDECIIGIHSVILDGARVKKGSIIGANAVITPNMIVPENSLVVGVPGKIVKQDEKYWIQARKNAEIYQKLSTKHKQGYYQTYH